MRISYDVDKKLFIQDQNWQYGMPGIVFLRGEVNLEMAEYFVDELNSLVHTKQEVIPIVINSGGGCLVSMFEMVDAIRALKGKRKILTYATGHACSAAAILLSAGDEGLRYASPLTEIMVHQVSSGVEGKAEEIEAGALGIKKANKMAFEILDENTGKPGGYWKELLKKHDFADIHLSPKQALKHNLINHVGTPELQIEVKVEVKVV